MPRPTNLQRFCNQLHEGIQRTTEAGHPPTRLVGMLSPGLDNAVDVAARLVSDSKIQKGLRTSKNAGMLKWTIEQAVIDFPSLFPPAIVAAAKWRLSQV
jgi:hypothetical protein